MMEAVCEIITLICPGLIGQILFIYFSPSISQQVISCRDILANSCVHLIWTNKVYSRGDSETDLPQIRRLSYQTFIYSKNMRVLINILFVDMNEKLDFALNWFEWISMRQLPHVHTDCSCASRDRFGELLTKCFLSSRVIWEVWGELLGALLRWAMKE